MSKSKGKGPCKACLQAELDIEALEAERDAYREAGARLAKEIHQSMYIPNLTLEMCREMVDERAKAILEKDTTP